MDIAIWNCSLGDDLVQNISMGARGLEIICHLFPFCTPSVGEKKLNPDLARPKSKTVATGLEYQKNSCVLAVISLHSIIYFNILF
mmetsp:Transcript_20917/g.21242  ORF Transcript_20917/g.21242 Transcript_20917/m.21242 type:complete len:85 (+) Transcript_20917:1058-1312(+)